MAEVKRRPPDPRGAYRRGGNKRSDGSAWADEIGYSQAAEKVKPTDDPSLDLFGATAKTPVSPKFKRAMQEAIRYAPTYAVRQRLNEIIDRLGGQDER